MKRGLSKLKRSRMRRRAALRIKVKQEKNLGIPSTENLAAAKRRPIRMGAGPRMKEWSRVWAWLKPRLEAAERTRCEFPFIDHECCDILDPAHSRKRRLMQGDDIYIVSIACRNAHRILDEVMTHAQMETAVWRAINEHGGVILPTRKAA
jgi:hypothetical protein